MTSRYDGRRIGINDLEQYENVFKKKNVKFIRQYFSPNLRFPSSEEMGELDLISHIWSIGDRYYKLAYRYYGDSTLWWVIAQYNQLPTDAHVEIGDIITIPLPLDKILGMYREE